VFSPGNQFATNPLVLKQTLAEGGANLMRGAQHLAEDMASLASGTAPALPEGFAVGKDIAVTPGEVILRNRVMELIQYRPATATVHKEPVLLVPAWLMKYYIVALATPHSPVEDMRAAGHT